jgi:hypothetical protein
MKLLLSCNFHSLTFNSTRGIFSLAICGFVYAYILDKTNSLEESRNFDKGFIIMSTH